MRIRCLAFIPVATLCLAGPASAQNLGDMFKRAAKEARQEIERKVEDKSRETANTLVDAATGTAQAAPGEAAAQRDAGNGSQPSSAASLRGVATADDSPAARDAALARLRTAAPRASCPDPAPMSRPYGSTCNNREFPAPTILAAPGKAWETRPGWWGAWSPLLVGNLMLTGSCNNDDNAGLSALDTKTGRTVWRIGDICAVGNRRGSTGNVAFHELESGEVLMVYPRDNGEPTDYYVVDPKAGRIVRSLTPAANVTLRGHGGSFTGVNQSKADGVSNLVGFNATLDQVTWRNRGFRLALRDDDPRYQPTFSPPAMADGVLYMTARSLDQPEPPTRQLHAIDLRSGQTLWRHTAQPEAEKSGGGKPWRSDDGTPMLAGGRVLVRVQGLLGAASHGTPPSGDALRALDPRSGAELWTTRPVAGTRIVNRVAVGDMLVGEVDSGGGRELWGWRLADGTLAWRRTASRDAQLLASSGGAFYVSERLPVAGKEAGNYDFRVQGFDGATGTQLWSTTLPGHNLGFDGGWGIVPDPRRAGSQGPAWRIGRDGAIYGVTLTGAFKLQ